MTIIENQAPQWSEQTQWRVAERPTLQIGERADGAPDRQFGNITAVHRLENGTFAVLDAWAPGLFFFDSKGGLLGKAGRPGGGPREFPPRSYLASFACGKP